MEGDYLKLNQFSYNSYSPSLETTRFLAHCVKDHREKQFWSPKSSREAHGNVLIKSDLCAETWEKKKRNRKMVKSIIIKILKTGPNWPVRPVERGTSQQSNPKKMPKTRN